MKIVTLVENTSISGLPTEHGLSLHISTHSGLHLLFDMGQSNLFLKNADHMNISVEDIDIAILSHGHYDHGGGLDAFLKRNRKAPVYIHKNAFDPHYSMKENGLKYIGLDPALRNSERLVFCSGITHINEQIMLFSEVNYDNKTSGNDSRLFGPDKKTPDTFCHEQNLLINEGNDCILFAGCAHKGITNILEKAKALCGHYPSHIIGGMHLMKCNLNNEKERQCVQHLAHTLKSFGNCRFHTMHCTGTAQFDLLHSIMGNQIDYLSCGEALHIGY